MFGIFVVRKYRRAPKFLAAGKMDKESKKTIILPLIEEKGCLEIVKRYFADHASNFIFVDKRVPKFALLKLLRKSKREVLLICCYDNDTERRIFF